MPPNEGVGLDDHQGFPPVEEFGQGDHGEASSRSGPSGLGLSFQEQGELLTQEQILSDQSRAGREKQPNQGDQRLVYSVGPNWLFLSHQAGIYLLRRAPKSRN